LELRVHKIVQNSSGGDHVTIYEADMELIPENVEVSVLGATPAHVEFGDYEAAIEAIRKGAERVLQPLQLGAMIRIRRIVLHPVDFKARKFELCTAEEVRRLMELSMG
jgi:hypothetical protein